MVEKKLLRMQEAAEYLNVSKSMAYKLAQQGVLPTIRLGSALRVPLAALEEWLRHQSERSRQERQE